MSGAFEIVAQVGVSSKQEASHVLMTLKHVTTNTHG